LLFCTGVVAFGHFHLGLGVAALQTLTFFTLVCGNQASTYVVRARRRLWMAPYPNQWLVMSSIADLGIAAGLAGAGWLMTPLPVGLLAAVLAGAAGFAGVLDVIKVPVFERLKISGWLPVVADD
jgi:H+-transporting ATPase